VRNEERSQLRCVEKRDERTRDLSLGRTSRENEPKLATERELHVPVVIDESSISLLRSKILDGIQRREALAREYSSKDEERGNQAHLRSDIERVAEKLSISNPDPRAFEVDESLLVEVAAVSSGVLDGTKGREEDGQRERGEEPVFARRVQYLVHVVKPESFSVLGTSVSHTRPSSVDMQMGRWIILD